MIRRIRATAGLCVILLASACSSGALSSEQAEQLVTSYTEQAQQYYLMNDLDRANAQCLKGLALDPENPKLRLIRGWTLLGRGKTEDVAEAQRIFEDLQSGGDFRAVLGLATALERRGLAFSEGADNLKSGKRITEAPDPEKRITDYAAEAQKDWRASRAKFMEALTLQKSNADAINGAMRVETLLGNEGAALAHAQHLLTVVQQDLDYLEKKRVMAGLTAQEESNLREQVQRKSRLQSVAHLHAAGLLVSMRRDADALPHLDEAARLEPDRPEIFSRRAQTEKELGRYADAIRDVERFIQLSTLDFNHPDIQRAWQLKRDCETASRSARAP